MPDLFINDETVLIDIHICITFILYSEYIVLCVQVIMMSFVALQYVLLTSTNHRTEK